MYKKRDFLTKVAVIVTLVMSVMLFIRNPLETHDRLNQAVWNTGHLFFFALLSALLLTQTALRRYSWSRKLLFTVLLSLVLGGGIEFAQYSIGRYMELQDVLQDILGGLLGFIVVVFYFTDTSAPGVVKSAALKKAVMGAFLILVILLLAFYPALKIVQDNRQMQKRFPLLAGFETNAELARWESDYVNRMELDRRIVKEGGASLRVEFGVSEYSDITLRAFPSDWRGYSRLNMSIYNAQNIDMRLELKIFDQQHVANGYAYSDRFNRPLLLVPGWNEISVRLLDIQNAARNREVDLQNISVISRPGKPQTIYLDYIHLSNY